MDRKLILISGLLRPLHHLRAHTHTSPVTASHWEVVSGPFGFNTPHDRFTVQALPHSPLLDSSKLSGVTLTHEIQHMLTHSFFSGSLLDFLFEKKERGEARAMHQSGSARLGCSNNHLQSCSLATHAACLLQPHLCLLTPKSRLME